MNDYNMLEKIITVCHVCKFGRDRSTYVIFVLHRVVSGVFMCESFDKVELKKYS